MKLLFVCSGNICRSPLAHVLAESLAAQLGLNVEVESAGTLKLGGRPASKQMVTVSKEIGIDLTGHRSQALTHELITWADHVVVMDTGHAMEVRRVAPDAPVDKVVPLGPFAGVPEIEDPYGSWTLGPYRKSRDLVKRAMEAYIQSLRSEPLAKG